MKIYFVSCIATSKSIEIAAFPEPITREIPLTWADWMIGCMPLFSSREDAEKYSEGKARIFEAEVVEL